MNMIDCPKFDKCSAPICPLDPDMFERTHLPGERVCFYLREYSKLHHRAAFWCVTPRKLGERVAQVYPGLLVRHASLKSTLDRNSKTPSKAKAPVRSR